MLSELRRLLRRIIGGLQVRWPETISWALDLDPDAGPLDWRGHGGFQSHGTQSSSHSWPSFRLFFSTYGTGCFSPFWKFPAMRSPSFSDGKKRVRSDPSQLTLSPSASCGPYPSWPETSESRSSMGPIRHGKALLKACHGNSNIRGVVKGMSYLWYLSYCISLYQIIYIPLNPHENGLTKILHWAMNFQVIWQPLARWLKIQATAVLRFTCIFRIFRCPQLLTLGPPMLIMW